MNIFSFHSDNRKITSILTIIFIAIIFILLAGKINYNSNLYSDIDLSKYKLMAESSPLLNFNIPRPYVYRILAPWIAGILPINIDLSFYLLNSLTLIFLAISVYFFLLYHKIEHKIALFVTVCFVLNRYFFAFLAFDYFQFSDTLSYLLLLQSFFLIVKKKWILLSIILILGILTREVALLIVPVGYLFLYEKKELTNDYYKYSFAILPMILIFIIFHLLSKTEGTDTYLTQFYTGFELFNMLSIIKKLFISVTPFAFISIIYYKELCAFFRNHLYLFSLFVGTVISSFFGFDAERLMSPAAPVFYLFLSIILQKIFNSDKWKNYEAKIFVILFFLAFSSTFYHLWGIIQLPNREITLLLTIVLNILILMVFLILKKSIVNNTKNSVNN
jgi:hypothetical protein